MLIRMRFVTSISHCLQSSAIDAKDKNLYYKIKLVVQP